YYGLLETGMEGTNGKGEVFYGSVYDIDNDKYVPVKVQEIGSESSKRLVRFFFGDRTVNNFIIDSTAKFLYAKEGTFKAFGVDRSYKVSFTSNANPCTVVNAYTLTVNNGSGSGVYGDGESVTVVANVPSGYRFVKWVDGSNNQLSTDISYTFNVSSNLTLTAVTEQVVSYTITVTNGTGSGSYEEGASVTVTPTIPNGYKFIKWVDGNGTEVSTSSTYVFNASEDITLTAVLEVTTPSITIGSGNYSTDLDSANPNSRVDISFLNSTWNSSYEPEITYTGYGYDINGNSVAVEVQKRVTSNSKFRVDLLFVKTNNPIIIKGGDVFTQKTVTANAPEQITFDKDYFIT
ncbi:MAG: InlB B-repeat-containing protein, partial [Firmicutes bacterium]|nr:InlB B-repeat-containing protein [Candidatus Caballimonas caccae]